MKPRLQVPIRELVEFTLRSGDLDLSTFAMPNPVDAIRAHQEIQRSRPSVYEAEVPVTLPYETDAYILDIGGRIDGVYVYSGETIIDEIKTTAKGDVYELADSGHPPHWGQAKCYAYVYARLHGLSEITVQLTYVHLENRRKKEVRETFDIVSLETFFESVVSVYREWLEIVLDWVQERNASIEAMGFPFEEKRPGQDDIIVDVEEVAANAGQLLIQAPTGIGKTVAVIYPSLKAIPRAQTSKIFFLTARTTGKAAAEDSLALMQEKGLRCKSITLTAKEKVCFNPNKLCNGKECAYARGYYDRINGVLAVAFQQDTFGREVVESIALEHEVCPFELSLELSQWADVIVCDYNYVFDPRVYLRRFFHNGENDYVFLVDEAHNLVDRSREMYSARVDEKSLENLLTLMGDELPGLYKRLSGIRDWMTELRLNADHEQGAFAETDPPLSLCIRLKHFTSDAEKWLSENHHTEFRQSLLDFYFEARGFLQIADRYDDSYATCYETSHGTLSVKLFCIDPARHLKEPLERSKATVFFSGTLSPMHYFIESLGCDEDANTMILPSPYNPENLSVLVAWNVSTLYKHRERTKEDVARLIDGFVSQRTGNYLVYFPSYQYMKRVVERFQELNPATDIIVQSSRMTEYERDVFIDRFSKGDAHPVTGFAVLGGVFAESIDLLGDKLTGAAIVGVGLPGISLERELIKDYFDEKNGYGFAFSYQIPGMIKVLQAAGRVIRSENDRGAVLLIGRRYTQEFYQSLFPEEWMLAGIEHAEEIEDVLQPFWKHRVAVS